MDTLNKLLSVFKPFKLLLDFITFYVMNSSLCFQLLILLKRQECDLVLVNLLNFALSWILAEVNL